MARSCTTPNTYLGYWLPTLNKRRKKDANFYLYSILKTHCQERGKQENPQKKEKGKARRLEKKLSTHSDRMYDIAMNSRVLVLIFNAKWTQKALHVYQKTYLISASKRIRHAPINRHISGSWLFLLEKLVWAMRLLTGDSLMLLLLAIALLL